MSVTRSNTDRTAGGSIENPWRGRLYPVLARRAAPLIVDRRTTVPVASVWVATRACVARWRERGARPGNRVVIGVPPGPAFVAVLAAALWERLTIVPVPEGEPERSAHQLDARWVVSHEPGPGRFAVDPLGMPEGSASDRPTDMAPTPDARFVLRTSGTTGRPKWVALSDSNVLSVIDTHAPALSLEGAVVASSLPWHHAFGLVIDLLCSMLGGAQAIIRPSEPGTDALVQAIRSWRATHACLVPQQVRDLASRPDGGGTLMTLRGGVVGGAPLLRPVCHALEGTSLRVGYGQTEASPGITLGEPGVWRGRLLGRPLGCETARSRSGELLVRGPNVHIGTWTRERGLIRHDRDEGHDRWLRTGDLVEIEPNGTHLFRGRVDRNFKLENGRLVIAAEIEAALRSELPEALEVAVSSPDHERIEVLVVHPSGPAARTPEHAVRRALGGLAPRLSRVLDVAERPFVWTPKGSLDVESATRLAG